MASIPSDQTDYPLAGIGTFSDVPTAPAFKPSPWTDERYVSHAESGFVTFRGPEILKRMGRADEMTAHANDWSLEVTFDFFPPGPEGYRRDVEALALIIGSKHVRSMITGRQRWVAWRPAQPCPYLEMIVDRDGQKTLSLDIRELPTEGLRRTDWDALFDGFRLLSLAAQQKAGRPKGSRNDLDHQTWLAKTRELRRLVRHENVSMPGAIARLELHTSPTTGWKWIEDLDQDEPEGPANSSS